MPTLAELREAAGAALCAMTAWEKNNPVDPRRATGEQLDAYNAILERVNETGRALRVEEYRQGITEAVNYGTPRKRQIPSPE